MSGLEEKLTKLVKSILEANNMKFVGHVSLTSGFWIEFDPPINSDKKELPYTLRDVVITTLKNNGYKCICVVYEIGDGYYQFKFLKVYCP